MFMLPCPCSPEIADVGRNLAKIHQIQRHCAPKSQAGTDAIANSHVFEVPVLLCLLGSSSVPSKKVKRECGAGQFAQFRSCPRNCKWPFSIQLCHWTCNRSGKADRETTASQETGR